MNAKLFRPCDKPPPSENRLFIIATDFSGYMRERGYAKLTIGWYQSRLRDASAWLADRKESLSALSDHDVMRIARRLSNRGHDIHALKMYRAALRVWLRFLGRGGKRTPSPSTGAWQGWLDDYDRFLVSDRGLTPATRKYRRRYARCFLTWMFRATAPQWNAVSPEGIWRFSERFARGLKPGSANVMLFSLKSFFRFLHLRGVCGPNLVSAVPHFSNYGQAVQTQVLSEEQRRRLLAAFSTADARGLRDRAIALCLLDLGLRAQEVAALKVEDVDWRQCCLRVPAVKAGRRRQLPLPSHIGTALKAYLEQGRPKCPSEHLFLRHRSFAGQPFSLSGLRQTMRRAFRRCEFPKHWTGTHRLRHSFASRLYAYGADPKQIADLLGHRDLASTDSYVQSDLTGLRALVRPWPS